MDRTVNDAQVIRRRFKKVYYEIDYIIAKIHKKGGFWIFKSHVYSIDELLHSKHHKKIFAFTEKIGDDANNWHRAGALSRDGNEAYFEEREKVEDALYKVNLSIESREPTWWENVKGVFTEFINIVVFTNMPDLVLAMFEKVANMLSLPSPLRRIFRLSYLEKG